MENPSTSSSAVPMRFFANLDTIRENNYTVPRALSMTLIRLTFFKNLEVGNNIVISVRLQGNKRTLRSNDISCNVEPGARIDLDISFVIQYAHFMKRKRNILEILIQRRKKYKNRQIPGFKSLATGILNLDEIFQMSGSREIKIFGKADDANDVCIASLVISHCKSVAVQQNIKSMKNQTKDSEDDEEIVDESSSDSEVDYLDVEQTSRMANSVSRKRRSHKKTNQKNAIKQRLVKILKRFKEPEEGNAALSRGNTASSIRKPTTRELEEIFQELENISDSGPEVDVDKLSIRSNPRPGLHRPFFGSKTDILPIIDDTPHSAEESDTESEKSSDIENANFEESTTENKKKLSTSNSIENTPQSSSQQSTQRVKHSLTARSLNVSSLEIKAIENPPSLAELLSRLDSEAPTSIVAPNVWICSSADFPWLSKVDFGQLKKARILDCATQVEIRAVVQSIISRIQKFCNSNSVAPPPTLIGIYGTDRHISYLLRAYVDYLQNKPAPEWISHLRFAVLCPPISALGRLLAQNSDTGQIEAAWRSLAKTASVFESGEGTASDLQEFEEILCNSMAAASNLAENRLLNLPIGEVMLQCAQQIDPSLQNASMANESGNGSQVFVPFLSEIHLGNLDALNYLYFMKNSMDEPTQGSNSSTPASTTNVNPLSAQTTPQQQSSSGTVSPPSSPQLPKTSEPNRELHLEYWTFLPSMQTQSSSHSQNDFYSFDSSTSAFTPGKIPAPTAGNKFSIKASLKMLSVAPPICFPSNLSKEKRKDKVLQKLGRKPKPVRNASVYRDLSTCFQKTADNFVHSRVVANVGKNSDLDLSIDGVVWLKIRFFQITSQWQTHVKFFPISVPSPPASGR
ncbi:hypothetical protein M3Y97_00061500 [Aphelenchoides bicaudatus]|nr:hypothetical protein M3Y97_00061500 [Aphelenchoides bicaudatus]